MPLAFILKAVLLYILSSFEVDAALKSIAPKQYYEAAERVSPKDLWDPDPGSLHPLFICRMRPEVVGFRDTLIQL